MTVRQALAFADDPVTDDYVRDVIAAMDVLAAEVRRLRKRRR